MRLHDEVANRVLQIAFREATRIEENAQGEYADDGPQRRRKAAVAFSDGVYIDHWNDRATGKYDENTSAEASHRRVEER